MKLIVFFLFVVSFVCFSQNSVTSPLSFKGEHYALYNKCKTAVTFCELTQQDYTSCGSVKNCYGLYVMPGDTFYINIEDKNQSETISADISFGRYLTAVNNFTFEPIDINCMPQQALQIAIPLTATIGSSFQIVAQNTANVYIPTYIAGVPPPFNIYVGGQQPQFTFALSDYTACPMMEEVSVKENGLRETATFFSPNPSQGIFFFNSIHRRNFDVIVYDAVGNIVYEKTLNEHSMDLSTLSDGMYLCKIFSGQNMIMFQRLVILK